MSDTTIGRHITTAEIMKYLYDPLQERAARRMREHFVKCTKCKDRFEKLKEVAVVYAGLVRAENE